MTGGPECRDRATPRRTRSKAERREIWTERRHSARRAPEAGGARVTNLGTRCRETARLGEDLLGGKVRRDEPIENAMDDSGAGRTGGAGISRRGATGGRARPR